MLQIVDDLLRDVELLKLGRVLPAGERWRPASAVAAANTPNRAFSDARICRNRPFAD
ncbi:hypothetical protein [Paraburkholderia sp. BR14374]|uniref:hypothetical protein n=1 Tax=Paraburkholderia sp. BR14374 TaxID=3237007 RepID=UPI0034CF04EE